MEILVWLGTLVSLAGLAGLIACIVMAVRARKAGLPDAALRARLQRIVAWNMAALFLSAIGLMMVIVGILLA
ncbi:hypothetical protein [Brevirhabdus sp.]|uniref:hypothetical protein n=1 Tax=Brevirhabdus sp. TaxID=2004514 RepID=UPI004058C0D2